MDFKSDFAEVRLRGDELLVFTRIGASLTEVVHEVR